MSCTQSAGNPVRGCTVEVFHPLQDLLPSIVKILQKGDYLGLALRIIECYLLLNQTQQLADHMPAVFAALERAVQAVLDYKETPVGPQFGRLRGTSPTSDKLRSTVKLEDEFPLVSWIFS